MKSERLLSCTEFTEFFWTFSIVLYSKKTRRFGNCICFRPQWLRLALSKGPNWVSVFSPPSPEDGNRSSFRNVVFFGIQDVGKSPEKFCEFCTTYTIVRILSSLFVILFACDCHCFFRCVIIFFPSSPKSPKWSLPFTFPTKFIYLFAV
jgi:hypothetical protein